MDMVLNKKNKFGNLISVSYSRSGDMNGNVDSTTLDVKKMLVITRYAVMHSDPIEVKEYEVTEEEVSNISNMIDEMKLLKLSDLPMGDVFAYDAATTVLSFTYDNSSVGGTSFDNYSINYYMKLTNKDLDKLHKFTDYLNSLVKEEKLVKSYKEG